MDGKDKITIAETVDIIYKNLSKDWDIFIMGF